MNTQTKIFLADDHVLLREALAKMINEFPDFRVIGSASNGKEAIAEIGAKHPRHTSSRFKHA